MVKVREDYPVSKDGHIDIDAWLERIRTKTELDPEDASKLRMAAEMSYKAEPMQDSAVQPWEGAASSFYAGLEMAEILADLKLDKEALMAAVLYRAVRENKLEKSLIEANFSGQVAHLIEGVQRMAAISLAQNQTIKPVLGQSENQLHNLRKMLVAMVDDVRVALIKLAERTCAIRAVKNAPEARSRKVAREVFDIYAPLAHRLGIGHIKWELEDLSFRYLHPKAYKKIASLLDEKRLERDSYIEGVVARMGVALGEVDIAADVTGRSKHIYSIWRKMKRKKVDFYQIYDIRAVRILVPNIRDCYASLGVVHSTWQHIPKEFDDYIASPKENGYRSLHTAVLGPESKVLEVQIRTHEMHDEAELGVCAHWHYKEGSQTRADSYEDKIAWLRQVLEWQEELGDSGLSDLVTQFSHDVIDERIYVFTPDGHVVDLAKGATPLDFAYHIHTEVGHGCCGAKVNGRIVSLTYQLSTGEQVEVLTDKKGVPSQDWLNPHLGYIRTSRARAKVAHWFKLQDREQNISDGKALLDKELSRLSLPAINWRELAEKINYKGEEDVYAAVGSGDLKLSLVLNAIQGVLPQQVNRQSLEPILPVYKGNKTVWRGTDLDIQGISNLMTQIAGCCHPVPGDQIIGYVSVGRGITVHRLDCKSVQIMSEQHPERMMEVSWSEEFEQVYPVDIAILAYDRQGLLRDISIVLANEHINVTAVSTRSNSEENTANMNLTLEVKSLSDLGKALTKLAQLPNIASVKRVSATGLIVDDQ